MARNHSIGERGEALAAAVLEASGYRILDRRFRCPGGEIDLVARGAGVVAFVEVKTRGPGPSAPPEAWVDGRKLARMRRTASAWMALHPGAGHSYRLDVVAVRHGGGRAGVTVRHLAGVG